jgi:hypothetical protein
MFYKEVLFDAQTSPISQHLKTLFEPGMSLAAFHGVCFREYSTIIADVKKYGEYTITQKYGTKLRQQTASFLLNLQAFHKAELSTIIDQYILREPSPAGVEYFCKRMDELSESELLTFVRVGSALLTSIQQAYLVLVQPKKYAIHAGLHDRLRHTEIRGVKGFQVKTPFPSIYVETSLHDFFLSSSEKNDINLIHVTWFRPSDAKSSSFSLYSTDLLLESQKKIEDQAGDEFHQEILNIILYLTNAHHRESLKEEATNQEWISLGDRIQKAPPGAKKERLKARRRELDPEYRIILGRGVKSLQQEKDELDAGSKHTVRTLVSGHWRNQIYGPRLDPLGNPIPAEQRKHESIWIEPFWKGEDWMPTKGEQFRVAR